MKYFKEQLKYSSIYELINPIFQRYLLFIWVCNGKTSTTPHLIKQQVVRKYATEYGLNTFVETGTYLGAMVDAVKNIFDKVYTIEIDKKLYERAKKKFASDHNVTVLSGDSGEVLPKVLTKLKTPTLFWLDAHYSGGITARGEVETPILEELKQVLKHKKDKVILVDDAVSFVGKGGYPSLGNVKELATKRYKNHSFRVEENIIVIK